MTGPSMPSRIVHSKSYMLHLSVESSRFAVRNILADLTEELVAWGLDQECVSVVELVAAEALNNVIEHAFQYKDGFPFEVKVKLSGALLILEIIDCGNPMPGLTLPETARGVADSPEVDVPLEELPEGGWGWFLIRDLTKELSYDRRKDLNHLVITMDA
ncbi:ATP-binding protein [Roseobacteraceae bacterium S113]